MKWFPILVLGAVTLTACATEDNLLQNADFTQKTLKGGIAAWRIVPQVGAQAKNGILRVVIDNPSRHKDKFSASVWQLLRGIRPGKYEFSGCYRGDMENLYLVLRAYTKENKVVNVQTKWIGKKDFMKSGKEPGWFQFFCTGTLPADTVKVSVHIESWGKKGAAVEIKNIELAEAEE